MWFQWFRKGINGLTDDEAKSITFETGLQCEWWRTVRTISPSEVADKLTEPALRDHVDHYDVVKSGTPFISLTAGVRLRSSRARGYGSNYVVSAQRTALQYATQGFTSNGHVFAGWVPILPHSDVALEGFAEDVRDLDTYSPFRRFHRQGEVTAKVHVPMAQLAWVERWDLKAAKTPGGKRAVLSNHWDNPRFVVPEGHAAIRDVL